jgi:hypothetical protein
MSKRGFAVSGEQTEEAENNGQRDRFIDAGHSAKLLKAIPGAISDINLGTYA